MLDLTLETGEVIKGFIFYSLEFTIEFQNKVSILTNDQYESLKKGEKIKKKDIQEFKTKAVKYYTLKNGKKYKKVKYADLTAAGMESMPKFYFLELLAEGKIDLFKKYITLGAVKTGTMASYTKEELIDHVNSTYSLIIQKGDKIAKDLENVKIQNLVNDNASVLEKLEAGEYGNINTVFGTKIKMGEVKYSKYIDDFKKLFTDYNN